MHRPKDLFDSVENDAITWLLALMICREAAVIEWMPILRRFDLILATQDWHPLNHGSFAANHKGKKPGDRVILDGIEQILWPVHCVQNTRGAEFTASFKTSRIAHIFHKGIDPKIDSYSTFFDNAHRRETGLA